VVAVAQVVVAEFVRRQETGRLPAKAAVVLRSRLRPAVVELVHLLPVTVAGHLPVKVAACRPVK
jgi:hypothetical protein